MGSDSPAANAAAAFAAAARARESGAAGDGSARPAATIVAESTCLILHNYSASKKDLQTKPAKKLPRICNVCWRMHAGQVKAQHNTRGIPYAARTQLPRATEHKS